MVGTEPVCQCERDDRPLCGFCLDDLFCPQCGTPITAVFSEELVAQQDRTVMYVYPDAETGEFLVTLASRCRDRDRRERIGAARLDLEHSWIDVADWFERRLDEFGPRDGALSQRYRLRPRGHLTGGNWQVGLPEHGLRATLHAEGAFRRQTFDLCICRRPEFLFLVQGDGILPAADPNQRTWRLGDRDQVAIRLTIEVSSPVACREDVQVTAESYAVRPTTLATKGLILTPGEPQTFDLTIDSRRWETNSENKLVLLFTLFSIGPHDEELTLRAVAMGKLKFWCGPRLLLEHLHLGDFLSSADCSPESQRPYVENVGQDNVFVSPPEVQFDSPNPLVKPWLQVTWADNPDDGDERPLTPGERMDLHWQVDLRDLRADQLWADTSDNPSANLSACVVFRADQRDWKLPIFVPGVSKRPPFEHWLAIDFGSTNTYVAAWHQSPTRGLPQIQPVLIASDPERFPSALFFDDLSCDPPLCTIGPEASAKGEKSPAALATGMKRWIGVAFNRGGKRQLWHLHDSKGREKSLDAATLVRLYLMEIIRQADRVLRCEIRRVGLSFPANFEPSRVMALRAILEEVRNAFQHADPPREIEFAEPRLDEATSVALGFVLDPDVFAPIIQPTLTAARPYVVIGSFDFGGGTIDTAVIKFALRGGDLRFARYASEYLGIGGDENFGGETITQAFLELVSERLDRILGDVAAASNQSVLRVPLARAGAAFADDVARGNHDALWAAAERIKIDACSHAKFEQEPTPVEENAGDTATATVSPATVSSAEREMREHLVQHLNRLIGVTESGDHRQLMNDPSIRAALDAALDDGRLLVPLEAVYAHTLRDELRVEARGTIRERLQACVTELFDFADRRDESLDFVVLAGAACRLPLVRQLIEAELTRRRDRSNRSAPRIYYDANRPKSKVAQGLERYLVLRERTPARVDGLASPGAFAPWPMGIVEPATLEFLEIIPACVSCQEGDQWFEFPAPLVDIWSGDDTRKVELYIKRREKAERWGCFDLSRPGSYATSHSRDAAATHSPLPSFSDAAKAVIRYGGSFGKIELRIRDAERELGSWWLEPRSPGASGG